MSVWVTWTIVLGLIAAREVYRWRRDRQMDRMVRLLEWRGRFAQDRRDLIHLIHCGEVDVNSSLVGGMYLFCSAIVRRAKRYPEFSRELVDIALLNAPKTETANRIRRDLKAMSPQAREIFHRYVTHVHGMLYDYSRVYRLLDWLKTVLPKPAENQPTSSRHRRVLWSKRLNNQLLVFHRTRKLCEISC